ncbi:MAG: gamma-glutamylcyclotransferase, partial [Dongiaceae bacterium]
MSLSDAEKALIESRRFRPEPGREFFVFAYGSLMWRPDFPFVAIEPATLYGYHRAFCITSTHYRGNAARP